MGTTCLLIPTRRDVEGYTKTYKNILAISFKKQADQNTGNDMKMESKIVCSAVSWGAHLHTHPFPTFWQRAKQSWSEYCKKKKK